MPFTEEQLSEMRGVLTAERSIGPASSASLGSERSKRQGMYRKTELIGFLLGMGIALLLLTGIAALASLY